MRGQGYCELQVDLSSGSKLSRAFGDVPGLIPVNKLHATIMYDERDPEIFPENPNKIYTAKVIGVKALGSPGSKWYAAVLELESPAVMTRFEELKKAGFEHSYPDLLLHVSLSYGEDSAVILPKLEELFAEGKLPETITLCNETWSTIED